MAATETGDNLTQSPIIGFRFESFRVHYDQTPGWWYVLDENDDGKVFAWVQPVRTPSKGWTSDHAPVGLVFDSLHVAVMFEFGIWLEKKGWT